MNDDERQFATMFVYESNLIENINISFETIRARWGYDANQNGGHAGALVSASILANIKNCFLTEIDIRNWQKMIIQEQNSWALDPKELICEHEIGQYRGRGRMFVGKKRCIVPSRAIPACIESLIEEINFFQKNPGNSKEEIIKKIADFHFDFLYIHPFVDGNGRTARIMTWYLFKFFNLTPFIFTSTDKNETYYRAFDGMRDYFIQKAVL